MKITRSEETVLILKQTDFSANNDMQQHGIHRHTNECSATVLFSEQLPEDGLVKPKHVAIECDFNDILK
jgi:hypothetical protein